MGGETEEIFLKIYSINDESFDELKAVLLRVLQEHHCEDLFILLFTCIGELLINAVKANYKNIYFENYSTNKRTFRVIPYVKALAMFRLEMQFDDAHALSSMAKAKGISADLRLFSSDFGIRVEVSNPFPMTVIEEENVTKKMRVIQSIGDMSDYFVSGVDDPLNEGAGLGLVFVGLMLKNLGIPMRNLSIESYEHTTRSTLAVSLDEKSVARYRSVIAGI
jgi:hypothetical protein